MEEKTKEELYEIIKRGNKKEVAAAIAELQKRDEIVKQHAIKAAIPAIITRNLSHSIGKHVSKFKQ